MLPRYILIASLFVRFGVCDAQHACKIDRISKTKSHKTLELRNHFQSNADLLWKFGNYFYLIWKPFPENIHVNTIDIHNIFTPWWHSFVLLGISSWPCLALPGIATLYWEAPVMGLISWLPSNPRNHVRCFDFPKLYSSKMFVFIVQARYWLAK